MIEVYSKNVATSTGESISLNNVALLKGASAQIVGSNTIQLNKCGIYQITVSDNVVGSEAGTISVQMQKNGVLQPQAVMSTVATGATNMSFITLVQVPQNNNINCPCSIPTTINFINTGVAATHSIDVTVVRV